MVATWLRRLTAVFALACAGLEPATGLPLLLSALELRHGDHAHSLAVVSDVGHVDVVLSHTEDGHHEHDAVTGEDLAPASSSSDHVYHITSSDLPNATQRRVDLAMSLAPTFRVALPLAPGTAGAERVWSAPHARSSDHLSTIVLRI
jgi:hypothetical protein